MGYPTPEMRERMQGVAMGTPPPGPAGPSSAHPKPPTDTTTED